MCKCLHVWLYIALICANIIYIKKVGHLTSRVDITEAYQVGGTAGKAVF